LSALAPRDFQLLAFGTQRDQAALTRLALAGKRLVVGARLGQRRALGGNDRGLLFDAVVEIGQIRLAGQRRFGLGQGPDASSISALARATLSSSTALRFDNSPVARSAAASASRASRAADCAARSVSRAWRSASIAALVASLRSATSASQERIALVASTISASSSARRFFWASLCAAGVGASARAV
jgi:hypothetical protein